MKTTFADKNKPNCEQREYTVHTEYSAHVRSSMVQAQTVIDQLIGSCELIEDEMAQARHLMPQ